MDADTADILVVACVMACVVAAMLAPGFPKQYKVAAGVFRLMIYAGLLYFGLALYARGIGTMTIFRLVEVPKWLFVTIVGGVSLFEIAKLVTDIQAAAKAGELRREVLDKLRAGEPPRDLLKRLVDGWAGEAQDREMAERIIDGEDYRETIAGLERQGAASAVVSYRKVIDRVRKEAQWLDRSAAAGALTAGEMPVYFMPALRLRASKRLSLLFRLKKDDLLFKYDEEWVRDADDLQRALGGAQGKAQGLLRVLRRNPSSKEWEEKTFTVHTGPLEIDAEKGSA